MIHQPNLHLYDLVYFNDRHIFKGIFLNVCMKVLSVT